MDFRKILQNFDATEKNVAPTNLTNTTTSAGSENTIKAILESFGDIEEGKGKPDFLDLDGDGNKKEPMKKAAADKKKHEKKKVNENQEDDRDELTKKLFPRRSREEMEKADRERNRAMNQKRFMKPGKPSRSREWGAYEGISEAEAGKKESVDEAIMVSAEGDELKAKLAKALEALDHIANGAGEYRSDEIGKAAMDTARTTLAELTGGKDMDMQDEYSNTPDEFEQDVDAVIDGGDRVYYDYYAKPELMGESVQEAKPDFLDLDKDGDRKESMKKAAADKKEKEDKKDKVDESKQRPYVCVHAKKGKHNCTASSSHEAAKKAAEHWNLKSTAGIDAHLADKEKIAEAIMVSAEGSEAESLLQILKLSGMGATAPAPEPTGGYDSGPLPALPEPADDMDMEMQDEYSNTPDEFEQDIDAVIDGGDDLHREKDQYAATEPGDNPMRAFEGKFKAILDDLLAEDQYSHSDDESKHA